jgi:hypothetical protein
LAHVELRGTDGASIDVEQERVSARGRELEQIELQWKVDGDRIDGEISPPGRTISVPAGSVMRTST